MNDSKNVCVIVPIYRVMTDLEHFSFNRMLKVFSTRKIRIIGPPFLKDYIDELCLLSNNISSLYFENVFGRGAKYYSRLLMTPDFYRHFLDYNYILICQTDVFVIKDDLDYWLKEEYDNIGAPIFEGYTEPSNVMKSRGLNSGFCLRNPKTCLRVLSEIKIRYSRISSLWAMESKWNWKIFRTVRDGIIFNYKISFLNPILNEDMFWSIVVPDRFPYFNSCEPSKAKYFSFDANPRFLYQQCESTYPMAIHAWWTYDKPFVSEIMESMDIKLS